MSAEALRSISIQEAGVEAATYSPSPYEHFFARELQDRFGVPLLDASLNEYGRLERVTRPNLAGERVVSFQYTRFPLLNEKVRPTDELLVVAFKQLHPGHPAIRVSPPDIEQMVPMSVEWLDEMQEQMDEEDRILEAIEQSVVARYGEFNPVLAVTDPSFYFEQARLTQWPETFEFVIFDKRDFPQELLTDPALIWKGRIQKTRADVYGKMSFSAQFEGVKYWEAKRDYMHGRTIITFPQRVLEVKRAYAKAYDPRTADAAEKDTKYDFDDSFLLHQSKEGLDIETNLVRRGPEDTMQRFGVFIYYLTQNYQARR